MWMLWLILCGVFLIAEIFTVSFLLFWPGIGAFLAFIASLFTDKFIIQLAVFVISTVLMLIFTKPIIKKLFRNKEETKMNKNSLIGKTGIVVKDINTIEAKGQVKVNGELWSAFSSDPREVIKKDSTVIVEEIEGVKLKVKKA